MDIEKFFEEKNLPLRGWEILHNGVHHYIDSDVVIEAILKTKGHERKEVEDMLFCLDFKNACILDYLKHLAKCLIVENSM
jgi:hypothetical protein